MAAVPRQDLWTNVTKTNETMKLAEDASWLETEALLVLVPRPPSHQSFGTDQNLRTMVRSKEKV